MVETWVPRYLPMKEKLKTFVLLQYTEVWIVCSHDTEIVICDQSFFMLVLKQGSRVYSLPINRFLSPWRTRWCTFQARAGMYL